MNRFALVGLAAFAGALAFAPALAEDASGVVTYPDNEDLKWAPAPPNLPKGMGLVVLHGDPSKPGPFVLRVMMPPGTLIAPHTHKTDENLTVISGNFYHAHGETVDKSQGKEVHTGGFVYLPAKHAHYLWSTTEPVVLQVTGTGPFGVDYINPATTPARRADTPPPSFRGAEGEPGTGALDRLRLGHLCSGSSLRSSGTMPTLALTLPLPIR